jgi:hypothetical protein
MAMSMLLRRLDVPVTVHRFRSSFLDWAAEQGVAFEVAEQCLARATGRRVAARALCAGEREVGSHRNRDALA